MLENKIFVCCSCLFQARKPFSPFLDALTADADFGTPPPAVATATGFSLATFCTLNVEMQPWVLLFWCLCVQV